MRAEKQKEEERKSHTESKLVYQGRVLQLQLETFTIGKKTRTFEIVKHGGAVVIIPIAPDGKILLIQQWRRAIGKIFIELPAGTLEKGEDPMECAKRELQEETGYRTKKIKPLGGLYSAPGFCNEFLHLYLAEDLESSPLPPDDDEMIDLMPVSLDEAIEMVKTNQIQDAKTVAGIFRYWLCVNG